MFLLIFLPGLLLGQENVGINTTNPQRSLEVYGPGTQWARIQTTTTNGAESALELILGGPMNDARDYKLSNQAGIFKIMTNTDNFETAGDELWRINAAGEVGIGTTVPTSRLHIDGGQEASNTGNGYMIIGSETATNIVMDPNEIIGRTNGGASSLYFQSHDGETFIGNGGGDTYIGDASGNLGIGTVSPSSRLSIYDDDFQLKLQNGANTNDWYIGASNSTWIAGDNQLLFSPSQASDDAILRLQDVTDNNGDVAPVMITAGSNQTLLLDGNEIDSKSGPLYINHNSNQETYINPSGGKVGMGTSDISATLQIKTQDDEYALRLQYDDAAWDLNPLPASDYLGFVKDGWTLGHVDGASGQWVTISDQRLKEDILDLSGVMDKLKNINVYTYSFKHDTTHTRQIGIIAQEIAAEFPELVSIDNGVHTVAYSKLSVIILKALQEQQKEIDALQNEIAALIPNKLIISN